MAFACWGLILSVLTPFLIIFDPNQAVRKSALTIIITWLCLGLMSVVATMLHYDVATKAWYFFLVLAGPTIEVLVLSAWANSSPVEI